MLTVSGQSWEGALACLVNVLYTLRGRECRRLADRRLRGRDSLGAVDKTVTVMAKDGHL